MGCPTFTPTFLVLPGCPFCFRCCFPRSSQCEAVAFGFSLIVSDGHAAAYRGPRTEGLLAFLSCF